jgi:hypothetical protein
MPARDSVVSRMVELYFHSFVFYFYYLIELQMGVAWWQCYCSKTRHKNIHITQNNTSHSTQSYTYNKGHNAYNEYNTKKKSKALPVTGHGGK